VKSKELCRWVKAWLHFEGHDFHPLNIGITAVSCKQCGLLITVRGRLQTKYHHFLARKAKKAAKKQKSAWYYAATRIPKDGPSDLRRLTKQLVYNCGELIVFEMMET
jgi:hypothetical protein